MVLFKYLTYLQFKRGILCAVSAPNDTLKKNKHNNKKEFIAFNNIFSHVVRVGFLLFFFFFPKIAILKIAGKVIMYWTLPCHFFSTSEFQSVLVYVFAEALKHSASSLFPFQSAVARITLAPFRPDACLGLIFHCSAQHLLTILPGRRSKVLSQKFYPPAHWHLSLQYLNTIRRMKADAYVSL